MLIERFHHANRPILPSHLCNVCVRFPVNRTIISMYSILFDRYGGDGLSSVNICGRRIGRLQYYSQTKGVFTSFVGVDNDN